MKVLKNDKGPGLDQAKDKELLAELPTAPSHFIHAQKLMWKKIGTMLIEAEILKGKHLQILEMFALYMDQCTWATKEINRLNKLKRGRGYIQTYVTGARNISPEVTLRDKATREIFICLKRLGLDPKSEKDIKPGQGVDPSQIDIWGVLAGAKKSS